MKPKSPRDKAPLSRLQIRIERGACGLCSGGGQLSVHNSSLCMGLPYLVSDKEGGAS